MNWKRGLLLAGLNLAAAVPMIAFLESRDGRYVREIEQRSAIFLAEPDIRAAEFDRSNVPALLPIQEEQTVRFDPCTVWVHYPVQEEVVRFGNMPASTIAGWRLACRPEWSLSGWLLGVVDRAPTKQDLVIRRQIDAGFCLLLLIQRLLIGGMPLGGMRKPWSEPGAFITFCTLVAAAIAMIRPIDGLAAMPALLAASAWLWWLLLLIWKGFRLAWRSCVKLRATTATM